MAGFGVGDDINAIVNRRVKEALDRFRPEARALTGQITANLLPTAGNTGNGYTPAPHTHFKAQIQDLEPITVAPDAGHIPKAGPDGYLRQDWLPPLFVRKTDIASTTTPGIVRVGPGLAITSAGVLYALGGGEGGEGGMPAFHGATHQPGGGDEVGTTVPATYAIPATGATSTLDIGWFPVGTTAGTLASGDDPRLTGPRAPLPHTHDAGAIVTGTVALARLPVAPAGASSAMYVVRADDPRLSNARAPLPHQHPFEEIYPAPPVVLDGDPAGGDLAGTYPDPIVARIQGYPVADTPPNNGEVLRWVEANGRYEPLPVGGGGGGSASGTVESVALSLPPAVFAVTGSPVTVAGTLAATFANQGAGTVFAGPAGTRAAYPPATPAPGAPGFRTLEVGDLPPVAHEVVGSYGLPLITVDGAGRVTAAASASVTAPLTYSAGALGIAPATPATPGSMSAADKDKLDQLSLGAGSGSVTNVGLSLPAALFTVTGSPITVAGVLTGAFKPLPPHYLLIGPAAGAEAAAPTVRALQPADLPTIDATRHGAQTDPNLHASATAAASGFLSAADKAKLDKYPAVAGLTPGHVLRALTTTTIGFGPVGSGMTVREVDGAPSVASVAELIFPNGSVTDLGGGAVRLTLASSGGGAILVRELDGAPEIAELTALEVPNGALTDMGGGVGRLTFPTSSAPTGAASGDLAGLYPAPTVAALRGRAVADSAPPDGAALVWNEPVGQWEPRLSGGATITVREADGAPNLTGRTAIEFDGATVNDMGGGVARVILPIAQTLVEKGVTERILDALSTVQPGQDADFKILVDDVVVLGFFTKHNATTWKAASNAVHTVASGKKLILLRHMPNFSIHIDSGYRSARLFNATTSTELDGPNTTASVMVDGWVWIGDASSPQYWQTAVAGQTVRAEVRNGDGNARALGALFICREVPASGVYAPSAGYTIGNPTGPASGDLSGAYPGPLVVGLRGRTIADEEPEQGEALIWNAAAQEWVPGAVATGGGGGGGGGASPLLRARYHTAVERAYPAVGSLAGAQIVQFEVADEDATGGAITPGSDWHYTAPHSGTLLVSVTLMLYGGYPHVMIYKNGAPYTLGSRYGSSADNYRQLVATDAIPVAAGDRIDVRMFNVSGTPTLYQSAEYQSNFIALTLLPPTVGGGGGGGGQELGAIWLPELPPETPSAYDDEFSDNTVAPAWQLWDVQGRLTVVEETPRGLHFTSSTGSNSENHYYGLYKALPAGDKVVQTHVAWGGGGGDYSSWGLALAQDVIADPTGAQLIMWGGVMLGGQLSIFGYRVTQSNPFQELYSTRLVGFRTGGWFRFRVIGATAYADYSSDGLSWVQLWSFALPWTPAGAVLWQDNNNPVTTADVFFSHFRYGTDTSRAAVLGGRRAALLVPGTAGGGGGGGGGSSLKYSVTLGDGVATVYDVPHGLGTRDFTWAVYDTATGEAVATTLRHLDDNTARLTFGAAPGVSAYRLTFVG